MDKIKLGKLKRAFERGDVKIDADSRTVEFPFSSEQPVERWFGKEILSHERSAVDLARFHDGANVLFNHDMDQVLGVIERAWIGDDKRGHVRIRFSKSSFAQEKFQDVQDGILRNVSFGYEIQAIERTKQEESGDTYTASKWMPYEVSIVSVPADHTVGIGRSADDTGIELEVVDKTNAGALLGQIISKAVRDEIVRQKDPGGILSSESEIEKIEKIEIKTQEAPASKGEKMTPEEIKTMQDKAKAEERERSASILALGEKFAQREMARELVDGGKSIDEARAAFLEKMGQTQKPVTGKEGEVGMNERDLRQYSFMRALNALANPTDRKAQEAAGFEREVSDAAAKKSGKASRGLMIPVDVLKHARRDLNVGTSTAGGNLVATDLDSASFIELLRKKMVVQQAGATVFNGLVGSVAIPKHGSNSSPSTGPGTAYWVAESGAPTESQQVLAQVSMSPKTVGAFTDISRKLLIQSSIDIENFVKGDLAQVIALAIDNAALYGAGSSNEPTGLKVALAAYNSASQESNFTAATPTFAEIVGLESKVTSLNADIGAMKYLINASMAGALKTKEKASGYPVYVLEKGEMNGYGALMSNQIASGDVFFGVWSQLILGFWSGLDLMVDPYAGSTSGTVRVVALQDCDIALRHHEAFARGNDTP